MKPSMVLKRFERLSELTSDAYRHYQVCVEAVDSEEDLIRVAMEYRKIIQRYVDQLPQ